ncbi:MAG: UDP-glucose 4-epimerase GalE [Proteobacteria bacterium]|nr:UDP-glucose 4-epimerase GalE [Pseudomonadota bacterium]
MTVLVTGGAGYIGSHMVLGLVDRGEVPVVLDNLSTGQRGLVHENVRFVEGSAGDIPLVRRLVAEHGIDAIAHFAGSIVVPDSVSDPLSYYANNTMVSRNLIEAALASGVKNFIFSSTAAVYAGESAALLDESVPTDPCSPYGRSKLMTEWMLEDGARAYGLRYVALRYFNVAGADPKGRSGQVSAKTTHLVKRACQAALGRTSHLDIFGTDYPTPDGTCVRDYIHVSDLIAAHVLALDYLRKEGAATVMNCGYGHGSSVRDILFATERVAGLKLKSRECPRRKGDVPFLVSDPRLIKKTLNWVPEHDDLDEIVRSAYGWESKLNSAA